MNKKPSNQILIGLEIHITLKSQKKIFNWIDNYRENILPNSQISPWELGYLGTLPIINPDCIELALRFALACQMKINPILLFDRKVYHYFDLPKGYQITQYRQPLASFGYLPLITPQGIENIPLKNLQLEEDTAKTFYTSTGVELDFNRAGNPLIELTTEPIFRSSETAILFLQQLQCLLRYLDISEAKMEKGQLRVDLNFSLNLTSNYQTPRYEVKNLNSFNSIEKALQYEINKHQQLADKNSLPPPSQTLGFDEAKKITVVQREKTDYFYLPENNIPSIKIFQKEIQKITKNIPTLPWIKWEQLVKNGVDLAKANLIIKKPLLLKTIIFLEERGIFFLPKID
jgi:aspartyl-tRNA(Asn)/glutamyl-tRNA(Gln) amidotransferase subunit B